MSFNAVSYVQGFSHSGKRVNDLSRISDLLKRLGNPHKMLKFVHIAGTNGKGSTLEYLSDIFIQAGYKTGQFTSPYIEKYNDRIRINGENISDERLGELCVRVKEAVSGECYSQFEITFAIALIYFLEEKCDIVFLEAGIGGLLDATNIIDDPLLSVITSVSLDHTQILGNTIGEIAIQKAGIIKKGCPVILASDNTSEALEIVKLKVEKSHSLLIIPDTADCICLDSNILGSRFIYKGKEFQIRMCGKHQINNALTAIEAAELLRKGVFDLSDKNIRDGIKKAKVKLRIELISKNPPVIADGGHNMSGIDSLIEILNELDCKVIGIVGMVRGKDVKYAAERLSGILDAAICADGYIDNNIPSAELKDYFTCPCEAMDYKNAIERAVGVAEERNAAVLICGSLYLASAVRREFISFDKGRL